MAACGYEFYLLVFNSISWVKHSKIKFVSTRRHVISSISDSVFAISRIIKISVRVISLSLRLRLITPTSTLIILDITKTSSNNYCLQIALAIIHCATFPPAVTISRACLRLPPILLFSVLSTSQILPFTRFPALFSPSRFRPFSIMLVKLAFNATRNSRIKPKKC